jgi:hypothetical protein
MSRILLRGIDGSNPLGYMAALGTLRLLSASVAGVRMHWLQDGAWRPQLSGLEEPGEEALCELLANTAGVPAELIMKALGKNITVDRLTFERFVQEVHAHTRFEERRAADFATSFGSEVCDDEKKGRIEYTLFCFITGSGHQDFLDTMRALGEKVTAKHLHQALFEPWRNSDKGLSMRWDPGDAREYALRWSDPGPEGAWTVWGANRLAIEALPLLPAFPTRRRLDTVGFRPASRKRKIPWPEFTWPIWTQPVGCDSVRTLVGLAELQSDNPPRRELAAIGVEEVYRAQRIRIGAGANFKVSFRPARAV